MVPEAVLPSSLIHQKSDAVTRDRAAEPIRDPGGGGAQSLLSPLGAAESWAAAIALAALIAMRVVYAFVYRVDSDEPQHLHVVWGWAHGLLQYRDLFDNHSPLFQMLCAPLFWALGEHPWIVVPMRLAMLPLFLADLWLVYLIGRKLYGQRWGIWMAIVAGGMPAFFLVTTEFRTDDPWTALWLAAVYLAIGGPMVGRRAFIFGLTMGACFAVSMKTTLLVISLGVAALELLALHTLSRRRIRLAVIGESAGLILAGLAIIPGLLIAFFAFKGALPRMYYCVIVHNSVPGLGKWAKAGLHEWLFPMALPVLLGLGWLCMHSSAKERVGAGRALIFMTCGAYYFLLRSYWPLVTAQDFIPILPLLAVSLLAFFFHLLSLAGWPARVLIPAAGFALLAGGMAWVWRIQSPFNNQMAGFEQDLAIVLHLTNPDDLVMDGKGETIYRNRPIYWVLEGITLRRIALGLIPDDVRARIIQTGTCVAVNHRLRPVDQQWLQENFLESKAKVWVAGKDLGTATPSIRFHTDINARYSIVAQTGKLAGTLDGAPLRDSQQIPAGDHELKIASGQGHVAVVWTQALDRGFDPFTRKISD